MGFRSVMIAEDINLDIPEWFREKYKNWLNIPEELGCISSKHETKFYSDFTEEDILVDLQSILKDGEELVVILLHECGGITRVQISKREILGSEPLGWEKVKNVRHDYCYGCSDVKHTKENPLIKNQ